jgi:hypothetical protein
MAVSARGILGLLTSDEGAPDAGSLSVRASAASPHIPSRRIVSFAFVGDGAVEILWAVRAHANSSRFIYACR